MNKFTLMVLTGCAPITGISAAEKPNLVIIHTDEHSFRTLSCYQNLMPEQEAFVWGKGCNSTTPNIDRIANEGAICMKYYCSSPVSTPSRASMITGLYPQATGAPKNGMFLSDKIPTFASILSENGYVTSYIGKWHLAGDENKYTFGIKYNGGFQDNTYMMTGGHAPYFHIKNGKVVAGIGDKAAAKLPANETIHLTDFFTDKALDILERDKNKPFCLMLSIPDPHTPDYARPPYHDMYKNLKPEMPFTMKPEYASQRPSWGKGSEKDKNEAKTFDTKALKQYFGMVKHIDDSVGRILKFLEDNGLLDNTIVVFTSDHGDMFFEHKRRNKGVPYEASSRIPFVIRYPGKIKAGKVINKAYVNTDFAPTILSLMGIKTDVKFHGKDTSADFTNKDKIVNGNRIVHFAQCEGWWAAATDGRYKLVIDKKESPWLIDMKEDPFELKNCYNDADKKAIAQKMQRELMKQLQEFKGTGLNKKQGYILK